MIEWFVSILMTCYKTEMGNELENIVNLFHVTELLILKRSNYVTWTGQTKKRWYEQYTQFILHKARENERPRLLWLWRKKNHLCKIHKYHIVFGFLFSINFNKFASDFFSFADVSCSNSILFYLMREPLMTRSKFWLCRKMNDLLIYLLSRVLLLLLLFFLLLLSIDVWTIYKLNKLSDLHL